MARKLEHRIPRSAIRECLEIMLTHKLGVSLMGRALGMSAREVRRVMKEAGMQPNRQKWHVADPLVMLPKDAADRVRELRDKRYVVAISHLSRDEKTETGENSCGNVRPKRTPPARPTLGDLMKSLP
jgi:hypothetical protein